MFQSEPCTSAEVRPIWKIDDTDLTDALVINSYNGRVDRNPPPNAVEYWAVLILEHVNVTLNGSVLSCSTNPALNYTLVVGKYMYIMKLDVNFIDMYSLITNVDPQFP